MTVCVSQSYDISTAGHQGIAKTLQQLQGSAYWMGMTQDVAKYCKQSAVYVSKQSYLHPPQLI